MKQTQCKLKENRGKFINFVEIGGNICNMHHWLRGMDIECPCFYLFYTAGFY